MRKNWAFKIGITLFFTQALVVPLYTPLLLGVVSLLCIGFLVGAQFMFAVSDCGVVELFVRAGVITFLILIAGRALFMVFESLNNDTSGDAYVGNVLGLAFVLILLALARGVIFQIRRRRKT